MVVNNNKFGTCKLSHSSCPWHKMCHSGFHSFLPFLSLPCSRLSCACSLPLSCTSPSPSCTLHSFILVPSLLSFQKLAKAELFFGRPAYKMHATLRMACGEGRILSLFRIFLYFYILIGKSLFLF